MLEVKDLKIEFYDHSRPEVAVRDVDFTMEEGEIIGLVGESGSGKSLTATAIAGLIRRGDVQISGEVLWEKNRSNTNTVERPEKVEKTVSADEAKSTNNADNGKDAVKIENTKEAENKGSEEIDLLKASRKVMRSLQGREIGFIFQDPMTAFSPVHKIGYQVEDALRVHGKSENSENPENLEKEDPRDTNSEKEDLGKANSEKKDLRKANSEKEDTRKANSVKKKKEEYTKEELKEKALAALAAVDLPDPERVYNSYPFELSGGMRQRAMIASAMISNPRLLIADEPTTALDVTVQAEIIKLLKRINEKNHTAILFISHDLGLVRKLCSKVIVLKNGDVVESGSAEEIFLNPTAEYTKKLIAAEWTRGTGLVGHSDDGTQPVSEVHLQVGSEAHSEEGAQVSSGAHSEDGAQAGLEAHSEDRAQAGSEVHSDNATHPVPEETTETELIVRNYSFYYPFKKNRKKTEKIGIRDINITVRKGEIVGLVGESGSGKSTLAKCIVGLLSSKEGEIIKGKVGMVFQDSYSALNPKMRVFSLLKESLRLRGIKEKEEQKERIDRIIEEVELPVELLERYPAELSGGQRQRVMIAMALLQQPTLLVADEPVSALDVAIQESILKLLKKLSDEHNMAILFISHDLRTVYTFCDKVLVMQKGVIVEAADKEELFANPKEEYTKLLLRSALE